ncbi:acyl-CoA synthetase (AMP-forming)/AMP-acid ligase II [Actinopolyspora biskrensis]|uniref:Acyl-CoA synthetase (AMP-forming)/AMP-acid ligase II n=1 Tax=Actinopolyspora biskrensis TaxID=1470178 RepID=A0A852YSQ6_9ACTN|nr:fatty acyl-AMP ligase [Actinopolyspora biskrensis]NYH78254.1 acyl-CoA synthetase (AMP-forming)/AMP-acid ligase II [Actinopolyspora biskrensis]
MESTTAEFPSRRDEVVLTDYLVRFARERGDSTAVTFVDYAVSKDGLVQSTTMRELHRRVCAVAAWLGRRFDRGERVVITAPQSTEYVIGFLGAIHAGLIAVPLFSPDAAGSGRLDGVLDDCAPSCALTVKADFDRVREVLRERGGRGPGECVAVDTISDALAEEYERPSVGDEDVAYLQYTSGSTRTPAGVEITHANVIANAEQALEAYVGGDPRTSTVSWLPLFHDMGLVLSVAAPLVGGISTVLMDPAAFLRQPGRWLRQLSVSSPAVTAAPNFAFDYCAARVTDREKAWLRLDRVVSVINGSEPVRPATIERFNEAFSSCGLPPESHRSSFGLAEATVFVSVSPAGNAPRAVRFDRAALGANRARPAERGVEAGELVSCGRPLGQRVAIVDPDAHRPLEEGAVGEIWVRGPNIGRGYWGRSREESASVFDARLAEPGELPERGWLRTGDLGVFHEGELYVTGRIKDLIVLDGRNHYPQDVEETVEGLERLRKHHTAAFAVTVEDVERLVVVAEYARSLPREQRDPVETAAAVRGAIVAAHGVSAYEVLLVEPDTIPRTSSGKVARRPCRQRYLDNELVPEDAHD